MRSTTLFSLLFISLFSGCAHIYHPLKKEDLGDARRISGTEIDFEYSELKFRHNPLHKAISSKNIHIYHIKATNHSARNIILDSLKFISGEGEYGPVPPATIYSHLKYSYWPTMFWALAGQYGFSHQCSGSGNRVECSDDFYFYPWGLLLAVPLTGITINSNHKMERELDSAHFQMVIPAGQTVQGYEYFKTSPDSKGDLKISYAAASHEKQPPIQQILAVSEKPVFGQDMEGRKGYKLMYVFFPGDSAMEIKKRSSGPIPTDFLVEKLSEKASKAFFGGLLFEKLNGGIIKSKLAMNLQKPDDAFEKSVMAGKKLDSTIFKLHFLVKESFRYPRPDAFENLTPKPAYSMIIEKMDLYYESPAVEYSALADRFISAKIKFSMWDLGSNKNIGYGDTVVKKKIFLKVYKEDWEILFQKVVTLLIDNMDKIPKETPGL